MNSSFQQLKCLNYLIVVFHDVNPTIKSNNQTLESLGRGLVSIKQYASRLLNKNSSGHWDLFNL